MTDDHDIKITWRKWYHMSINRYFQFVMNVLVIVSSISLALDDPFQSPDSWQKRGLFFLDLFFVIAFGIEATIKIIA